jgi:hypothetical protein
MPPAILPAAMLGGGALSAGMQVMQGISDKKAANAQAAAYEGQAGLERENAGMQVGAIDYRANQLMGIARANAGASGVTQSGSPRVIQAMNASEAILQETAARYGGNLKSSVDIAAAANARLAGRQALTGAVFKAGGSLLTSAIGTFGPTGAGGLGAKPSDLLKWSSSP